MSVQAVTQLVQPHGLVGWPYAPPDSDHENFDADQDELACPDIDGHDEPSRPIRFKRCAPNPPRNEPGAPLTPGSLHLDAPGHTSSGDPAREAPSAIRQESP